MDRQKLRIGQGIDVHPLVSGRRLIIGGIEIEHDKGLDGHSDADVLTHSIMDALLGAAGKGDIGTYFPPSDEKWRGSDSVALLSIVKAEITKSGWSIENVDCTVLAEAPKLCPYIAAMKQKLADCLSMDVADIGIKATTSERLGFVGRGEGIVAQSVALLRSNS